jgi:hypothetical protein
MAGSCKHNNVASGFLKGKIIDQMSNYKDIH